MLDEKVITKTEEGKEEPKEKSIGQEVREKSFYELLKESRTDETKPLEEKPVEPTEEEKLKLEEDKKAQDAKEKLEADEAAKKRDEDIAKKAADEVIAKQKLEEQTKADKIQQEQDEKEKAKSLQPKWKTDPNAPKDKDGHPVPTSYDELQEEATRIAKEQAKAEIRAELAEKEQAKAAEQAKAVQTQEQQKATQKAFEDQLQKELDTDLNAIYAAGDMPKVKDPKNENDAGNKEFKNLFETAQRVNAERMAQGKPLIRSIQIIRYGRDETGKPYYKPLGKPAGHDAPVLGNESPISHEAPEDKYIPSRDRNKTMAQLVKEEASRLARKLNVRGA